jgi:hypothetical protein
MAGWIVELRDGWVKDRRWFAKSSKWLAAIMEYF